VRSGVKVTVAVTLAAMFAAVSVLFVCSDWLREQSGAAALIGGIVLALAGMAGVAFVLCYAIGSLLPGALDAPDADELDRPVAAHPEPPPVPLPPDSHEG
jgi:hypothetical protein